MNKFSAGILVYKFVESEIYVLIAHPGGPFFAKKDEGAWSIPKGEYLPGEEDPLTAAKREFLEETGIEIDGDFIELSPVTLKSGKNVNAWAIEKNIDVKNFVSNKFEMEWPPKSGRKQEIPEIDKLEWFSVHEALKKINPAQAAFIIELPERI